MKKWGIIAVAIIIAVAVLVAFMFLGNKSENYDTAYENTAALKSYKMDICTIVTIKDGENTKQSIIEQTVRVADKGESNMLYEVVTNATSIDSDNPDTKTETNSYIYSDSYYYYSYPGVQYKSPADSSAALSNINKLSNIITFAPSALKEVNVYHDGDETVYEHTADFADVSEFIQATLKSAIGTFSEGNFSKGDMWATAYLKDGYVTKREFSVTYAAGDDKSVTVEVYTELFNTKENIQKPDDNKYVEIAN